MNPEDHYDKFETPGDPGGSGGNDNGGGNGTTGAVIVNSGTEGWASLDINNIGSTEMFLYFATEAKINPVPQVLISKGETYTLTPALVALANCYAFTRELAGFNIGLVWKDEDGAIIPAP